MEQQKHAHAIVQTNKLKKKNAIKKFHPLNSGGSYKSSSLFFFSYFFSLNSFQKNAIRGMKRNDERKQKKERKKKYAQNILSCLNISKCSGRHVNVHALCCAVVGYVLFHSVAVTFYRSLSYPSLFHKVR